MPGSSFRHFTDRPGLRLGPFHGPVVGGRPPAVPDPRGCLPAAIPHQATVKAVNQVDVTSRPDSDPDAIRWWEAYQLAEAGEIDQLRTRTDSGDDHARRALASLLAEHGSYADAVDLIRPLADAGEDLASLWLARWLADSDPAELRRRAQAGDFYCLQVLADSVRWRAQAEEWREVLCTPDGRVRPWLEAWLARQGDVEVIRIGAEAGDEECQRRLARWHVRMAEYRRLASAGDKHAQRMVEHWRGVSVS